MNNVFTRLFDAVLMCSSEADVLKVIFDIKHSYDLSYIAYFFKPCDDRIGAPPKFLTTYSDAWIEHYIDRNFITIDPVLKMGFQSFMPLDWSGLNQGRNAEIDRMFGEAGDFGIGGQGMTFPIHCNRNGKALFSVTSDMKPSQWVSFSLEYCRDFQMLGHAIHEKVRDMHYNSDDLPKLTKREAECLQWISVGKTASETAMILDISERTVRYYLEEAKRKLESNNITQAAVKAERLSLLFSY